MRSIKIISISIWLAALVGCSTTQQVTLGRTTAVKHIETIAHYPEAGNSSQMDGYIEGAVMKSGLALKQKLPEGTRITNTADAVISYIDVWRWDIVMYLKELTIKITDGESGDLIALGYWSDSAFHGFRDAKVITEGLTSEMVEKIRQSEKKSK